MRASDFMALDRWAAARAARPKGEPELYVVAFDQPALLGIRTHAWQVGNVVFVNGVDYAYFETKAIAELFARWRTFEGKPAKAVPA